MFNHSLYLLRFLWLSIVVLATGSGGLGVRLAAAGGGGAESFNVGPAAAWVDVYEGGFPQATATADASSGVSYLLVDEQVHADRDARYSRYVSRIENFNGVESQGRLQFYFAPTYQGLVIHHIDIIRDGVRLNRLNPDAIKFLQRETDLALNLYDESLTALAILEDLRVGDVLDYAYTVSGSNPAFEGRFVSGFSFQYGVPVERMRCLLRVDASRELHFQAVGSGPEPTRESIGSENLFRWEDTNVAPVFWEDDAPGSVELYAGVRISEFGTWGEVVDWALPLYEKALELEGRLLDRPGLPDICRDERADLESRVEAAIRFVQDEVRYFGMEIGPNSYVPHRVEETFERRFGDCKDKSVLLLRLLREMGLEAQPVLLSASNREAVLGMQPSPYAFDHVTVRFRWGGRFVYVDATYSYQRGSVDSLFFPRYGAGLPLFAGARDLVAIPEQNFDQVGIVIEESFVASAFDEPVRFSVSSRFTGGEADDQRGFITSSSRAEIERQYFDFYGRYYDGLATVEPMRIEDDEASNRLSIHESYSIENAWTYSDSEKARTLSTRAGYIAEGLVFPSREKGRQTPIALRYPYRVEKKVLFELPKAWGLADSESVIENDFFRFARRVEPDGPRVVVSYAFVSKAWEVPVEQVEAYLDACYRVDELLTYELSDDYSDPMESAVSSHSADVALLARQTRPFVLMSSLLAASLAWVALPMLLARKSVLAASIRLSKEAALGTMIVCIALAGYGAVVSVKEMIDWCSVDTLGRSSMEAGSSFIAQASLLLRIALVVALVRLLQLRRQDAFCMVARSLVWTYALAQASLLIGRIGISGGSFGFVELHGIELLMLGMASAVVLSLVRPDPRPISPPLPSEDPQESVVETTN